MRFYKYINNLVFIIFLINWKILYSSFIFVSDVNIRDDVGNNKKIITSPMFDKDVSYSVESPYESSLEPYPNKISSSPTLDEFTRHAYIVHVGNMPFEKFDTSDPWDFTVLPGGDDKTDFLSYWTLGSVVFIDTFKKFIHTNSAIIIPLASVYKQIVSVSAHEVMLLGPVKLNNESIIIVNKHKINIRNHLSYNKALNELQIKAIYYTYDNYIGEESIVDKRLIVHQVLKKLGAWTVNSSLG